ncbi:unnamed protein product [Sphenostylis stenocarpa]|uniref:Uncharacterized protein n=1 Tax=Sphenostylis stenocarpa TaxID=92480 RepID=A0AA86SSZ1_9FABA|nr:unnamed protein product [Sphenostylis stenocarpa]
MAVGAAVNCNNKQVLVVAATVVVENCIELGEVVVKVMVGASKVQDVVVVNAPHKVVAMVEAAVALYKVGEVVVVLYKVEEMVVVVVNGLVVVESEQGEVGVVTDRDKQAEAVNAVGAVVNVVGAAEASAVEAVVDYSSIAQVVVGRIQDLVEVEVMAEAVKVGAETLHNILVRVVAVRGAVGKEEEEVVNRQAVAGMAEVAMVAVVRAAEGVEDRLAVAVRAEEVKVGVEGENKPVVEVVAVEVEANTLEVVVEVSTLVVEAAANTRAVVAEGNEGHKQATAVVTEEEEEAR